MENRNVLELLKQYTKQSESGKSLADGEIEARDGCLEMCDCCTSTCLCTSACVDCFT